MSSIVLGADSTLKIGAAANSLTEISGLATGTDTFALSRTPDTSEVPGGGASYLKVGRFVNFGFSFVTDANATTDPLLRAAHGTRMHFEFNDGQTVYKGEGIFHVTKNYSYDNNRITYNVTVSIDGKPSES